MALCSSLSSFYRLLIKLIEEKPRNMLALILILAMSVAGMSLVHSGESGGGERGGEREGERGRKGGEIGRKEERERGRE